MFRRASLLVLLSFTAAPLWAANYAIQVVDSATGRGVPLVKLTPQNGTTVITDSNGIVAFNQSGLMNTNVAFNVSSYGYNGLNTSLLTTTGSSGQISINRTNIAERIYRLTGQGIYQDSVAVGASVPIAQPLLNANVAGQDSVQAVVYNSQIYWFFGDTLYASGGGNFRTSGARSLLPGQGGLDPSAGVDLNYFANATGSAKEMMPVSQSGAMWIDGVFTARDPDGIERLMAHNARFQDLSTQLESGLALFNDSTQTFQRFQSYSLTAPITPQGHSFNVTVNGQDYIYFDQTYPDIRVKNDWNDVTHITNWEAYSPLKANTRWDANNPQFDRDSQGNIIFGWKQNTDPLSYEMLQDISQHNYIPRNQLPFRLQNVNTGQPIDLHRSSVYWNDYRKSWVMIGVESFVASFLGEVYFSEAPTPEGPWVNAIKVATHNDGSADDYSYYNPTQHPFFDQDGGRTIYFDGTYSNTFSGNSNATPLYDYNEMMYRLDLAKIPNLFPRSPGDYNRDGVVNMADYIVWRNSMAGDVDLAADGNGDGFVTAADYDVWRAHFGATAASGVTAQAVPEPDLGALLFAALIGALTSSRIGRPTGHPSSECRLSKG
jgi:hypothetical protein